MRLYDGTYDRWDGLVWGLGLIAMGVLFLMDYLGMITWGHWNVTWPWLVIAIGVIRLLTARRPRIVGAGVTVTLIGTWFLVAVNNWYGLGWARSWPLALVAVGLGSLARAVAASLMPKRADGVNVDVCC